MIAKTDLVISIKVFKLLLARKPIAHKYSDTKKKIQSRFQVGHVIKISS